MAASNRPQDDIRHRLCSVNQSDGVRFASAALGLLPFRGDQGCRHCCSEQRIGPTTIFDLSLGRAVLHTGSDLPLSRKYAAARWGS